MKGGGEGENAFGGSGVPFRGLDPTLAYEFGVVLSHRDLDEEDIPYFDLGFLPGMGISVANHRLKILKLAKSERRRPPRPVTSLLVAADRTRKRLTGCLSVPAGGDGAGSPEPATTAPRRTPLDGGGRQCRSCVSLKREKKLEQQLKRGSPTLVSSKIIKLGVACCRYCLLDHIARARGSTVAGRAPGAARTASPPGAAAVARRRRCGGTPCSKP